MQLDHPTGASKPNLYPGGGRVLHGHVGPIKRKKKRNRRRISHKENPTVGDHDVRSHFENRSGEHTRHHENDVLVASKVSTNAGVENPARRRGIGSFVGHEPVGVGFRHLSEAT